MPTGPGPRATVVGAALAAIVVCAAIAAGPARAASADPATLGALQGVAPPGPALQGDPVKGKELYSRCVACHALAYDRTGPRHCGLLGRRAGAIADFTYSKAMKDSGIVWTRATLDAFLANPMKSLPGTFMGYAGVTDRQERADLVAYLAQASVAEECRK